MRLVVDDTFNRIQKLILSRTVGKQIRMNFLLAVGQRYWHSQQP